MNFQKFAVVLGSIGFLQIYVTCSECGINYFKQTCPKDLCCSADGLCGDTIGHCLINCQPSFGLCWKENNYTGVSRCGTEYSYLYCSLGRIKKNFNESLRLVTCEGNDRQPTNDQECVVNQIYRSPVKMGHNIFKRSQLIVDGDLVTCLNIGNEVIQFETQVAIKEIRITMRKTKIYTFTLEVLRQNDSFREFVKHFDDVIKYGYAVVFSVNSNVDDNHEPIRRYIQLTPHSEMIICEMEVSALEQKVPGTNVLLISCSVVGVTVIVALITFFICRKNYLNPLKQKDLHITGRELSDFMPKPRLAKRSKHSNMQEATNEESNDYEAIDYSQLDNLMISKECANDELRSSNYYLTPIQYSSEKPSNPPPSVPLYDNLEQD